MSPALAFGWYVWTRHRLGLTLCAAYWLLLLILASTPLARSFPSWLLPFGVAMPSAAAFGYLVCIFSVGLEASLAVRESGFPPRLWALPLRSWSLVGWPMLWGTSVLALAWLLLSWGVLRLGGFERGLLVWWPALMLAATLAWLQALVWSPFPLPGLRLFLIGPVIGAGVIGPVFLLAEFGLDTSPICLLMAVQLPIAYGVAVHGVGRARRGDAAFWDWPSWLRWNQTATVVRQPFASAAQAQWWFERRRSGPYFALVLAGVVLIWLVPLPWYAELFETAEQGGNPFVPSFLLHEIGGLWLGAMALLGLPILMGGAHGLELGGLGERGQKRLLSSFAATRPVSTAALIRAKFLAAAWTTLLGWGVLIAAFLLWFALGGHAAEMANQFQAVRQRHGPGLFWGWLTLLVGGAIVLTWLHIVQSLWLGLAGRTWGTVISILGITVTLGLFSFGEWLMRSPDTWPVIGPALPWLAGVAVALKCLAATWSLRALQRAALLPPGVIGGALAVWLLLAAGVFGALAALLPEESFSVPAVILGIVLALPLTRLALAPLMLARGRHG